MEVPCTHMFYFYLSTFSFKDLDIDFNTFPNEKLAKKLIYNLSSSFNLLRPVS